MGWEMETSCNFGNKQIAKKHITYSVRLRIVCRHTIMYEIMFARASCTKNYINIRSTFFLPNTNGVWNNRAGRNSSTHKIKRKMVILKKKKKSWRREKYLKCNISVQRTWTEWNNLYMSAYLLNKSNHVFPHIYTHVRVYT